MMSILCVDLKSFFASCECSKRGLDAFKTPLIVANPHQGQGAMTLAVTPYLKEQGVKSRSRLYEIPRSIKYTIVPPRLELYKEYSKKILDIYLTFVAREDIFVYSIDECFIDISKYITLYKKTDNEIAKNIMEEVYKKTKIRCSTGIGPNMFVAKVALDLEAKNNKGSVAKWTKEDLKTKLWPITNLTSVWGIGSKMSKKLNTMGIFSIMDLACFDKKALQNKLGINGITLWENVNGYTNMDIKSENERKKDKSISHSKMFLYVKTKKEALITIKKLIDDLAASLREQKLVAKTIYLEIKFNNDFDTYKKRTTFEKPTSDEKIFISFIDKSFLNLQNKYIRQVTIRLSNLTKEEGLQLNIFDNINTCIDCNNINKTIDNIKLKHGQSSIKKASYLMENKKVD